uniref:Mitochondrial fission 1 protein n=1 Tax=Rhizophora mucronata TaxID=61149 RepID=A0A2P2K6X9_RHIMU
MDVASCRLEHEMMSYGTVTKPHPLSSPIFGSCTPLNGEK